jgi:hypothetical protein
MLIIGIILGYPLSGGIQMKHISVIAIIMLSLSCTQKQTITDYAVVSFFIGDVSRSGSSASLSIGDVIRENDIIITGERSSCDVKLGSSIIRIKEKSKMSFAMLSNKNNAESTSLELQEGKLLCKPKKLLKGDSFTVKTPTAVAAVRGTEFTIEADPEKTTRIKVFDGKVAVAKRVKAVEDAIPDLLATASPLEEKQSAVIKVKDVEAAEAKIEQSKKSNPNADTAALLNAVKEDIAISPKEVTAFKVEDFSKEGTELVAVKNREPEVVKKVQEVIKKDKKKDETPAPEGRLLITRYEVYFIRNGRVEWEGNLTSSPVRENDKIYIASDNYVFCASPEGPVYWKKQIANDGKIELKGSTATIFVNGKSINLNASTGKEKM